MRYWLMGVPRHWGRQPFEVAFQIGVVDLNEVAALKRIGGSLALRSEGVELDAAIRRVGIGTSETTSALARHYSPPPPVHLRRQVVTRKGRIAFACPLDLKRLLEIATRRGVRRNTPRCATPTPSSHAKLSSRAIPGSTRPDYQPDTYAQARQHVDQSIGAEQINATAQEVAHPRLRDPKHSRGLGLGEMSRPDRFLHLNQQVGMDEQVF